MAKWYSLDKRVVVLTHRPIAKKIKIIFFGQALLHIGEHGFVHCTHIGKWSTAVADDVMMSEVGIACEVFHNRYLVTVD